MLNIQRNEEFPAGSAACCSASLATSFTAAGDDHTSLKKKLLGCGKVCHEEPIFRWAGLNPQSSSVFAFKYAINIFK